jgi:Tfp pilus assembly protein PilX
MRNEGFALVLAMMMSLVLTLIAMGAMDASIFEAKLAGNELMSKKAFFHAESGLELWRSDLINGVQ